jgi:hypothetical protein
MKKSKKTEIVMIAVVTAASVVLPGFFSQGQASENAPKDAFVAGSRSFDKNLVERKMSLQKSQLSERRIRCQPIAVIS